MANKPTLQEMRVYKDLLGNQGFPWNCFDTCNKSDCVLNGCAHLAKLEAEEREKSQAIVGVKGVYPTPGEMYEATLTALSEATGLSRERLRGTALRDLTEEEKKALRKAGIYGYTC